MLIQPSCQDKMLAPGQSLMEIVSPLSRLLKIRCPLATVAQLSLLYLPLSTKKKNILYTIS